MKFRQDNRIEIFLPGSEIPEWFSYRSEKDSLSFQVPSQKCEKIIALVLCAILSLKDGEIANISREVFINGQNVIMFSRQFFSLESDHVWLYYLPRRFIRGLHLKQNGFAHFEVSFKVLGASTGSTLKRCGVYLVCKQDEVAEDPSVSLSLSYQMESMSVDLKRSCGDDLELKVCSNLKKNRTTEVSPMANNSIEYHLEPAMAFNTEHRGEQWLSLSLQSMFSKKLEDKVRFVSENNVVQPVSTSQLQHLNLESYGYPHRNQTTEEHVTTSNAHENECGFSLALTLQPVALMTQDPDGLKELENLPKQQ
ncbi:hypothetical protein GH714_038300 [Hevea brasiliensis]|uniref:C-JID domain-containing protein n=1 Tax=Hevea brasiliensis TaxID=3981 RepID=A0A6A6L0D0_HEVBR|nr:hypothetical protein GH714_038300 [Hevea brasiliensis]